MPAPDQILKLVDRFTANIADLKSANQNESSTRQDYIDPFFRALGWDVGNQQGRSEAEKEVKVEVSIRVDDARKAPDYGFYHNGELQFFVEAKKPIVNLKYGTNAAFQIRRYAWSTKKIALSILTDFEELAIYDCRTEPLDKDSADTARLKYFDYKEYPDKWDEIANLFSREAVAANSLDSYTASLKNQKGIVTVDAAFLKLIEHWRELLAKNLARRNPNLSQRELNSAVQTTIDRIIFLRFCEERDIQPYEEMKQLLDYSGIYERLCEIFNRADVRYNSGLFHLKDKDSRDHWMLGLKIDDAPLKDILYKLYYPAPYAFKAIPVEILGQVYEQFLGKVITLSPSHEASIEEKPEVRKAGGVYYTPGYIVEYIVKNTVGKLLEGQNPDQAAKLKILDPACGSGSFLLGAYQFLLDWYLNYYVSHNPTDHYKKKRLRSISTDTGILWQLTTDEKKRILLNNLYGVDIDTQAVEVTKLSLLLKMVEDESAATQQLQLMQERLLPDLDNNIKCGNSLIGPDIYSQQQMSLFSEEDDRRINIFDWKGKDGFSDIMKAGGFDAIIGNPPYIRVQALNEWAPIEVEHYKKAYQSASKGNYDIYVVFVERGLSLLNNKGVLGYILPHKFFNAQYGQPLRQLLAQGKNLSRIIHFGDEQIFANATTYTNLLFLDKSPNEQFEIVKVDDLADWRSSGKGKAGYIPASSVTAADWNFTVGESSGLFDKLSKMPVKLGNVAEKIFQGLVTSSDSVYLLEPTGDEINGYIPVKSQATGKQYELEIGVVWPLCKGSVDVRKYKAFPSKRVLFPYDAVASAEKGKTILIPENEFEKKYPKAWSYLLENFETLRNRENGKMKHNGWYGYVYPKSVSLFAKQKILTPSIAANASFAFDEFGELYFVGSGGGGGGGYGIIKNNTTLFDYKYLLGLLNCQLLNMYLKQISSPFRGGYYAFNRQYIEQLPIRVINFDDPADKARHDQMVRLVERMLDLHKRVAAANLSHEKTALQRQIEGTDKQIDQLVYQLYQLTPEEITIVEG